jgi:thiamine-monophosphate kinase
MPTSQIIDIFKGPGPRLSDRGEANVIVRIRELLAEVTLPSPYGMGDDCAVLPMAPACADSSFGLATVDAVTLGDHFTQSCPSELVGRKLVHRNVSDIAAMGGVPKWALLTILSGANLRMDWLDGFIGGVRTAALGFGMHIVGGDISALPAGMFSAALTVYGHAGKPILRTTAKDGDAIWVTGELGGSRLGHHLSFSARIKEGLWLVQQVEPTAMMDISDGLAKDLPALLPAGCIAALETNKIPISKAAFVQADNQFDNALRAAFCDGEDYELLFCAPQGADAWLGLWQQTFPQTPISCIGHIQTATPDVVADGLLIDAASGMPLTQIKGYEHFCSI